MIQRLWLHLVTKTKAIQGSVLPELMPTKPGGKIPRGRFVVQGATVIINIDSNDNLNISVYDPPLSY